MNIVLAATHHDPDGRIYDQMARTFPPLRDLFGGIAILLTPTSALSTREWLARADIAFEVGSADQPIGHLHLGRWRRGAVQLALTAFPKAEWLLFCDLDRVLHWVECWPDELAATIQALPAADLTVLGRTPRALASHPRAQVATETVVNEFFARITGQAWDVMAAARGLSRRAAELIVTTSRDDSIGADCTWLQLAQQAGLKLVYRATEGLEFETLDRYLDEVAILGGAQAWLDRFDADPRNWLMRIDLARAVIVALSEVVK
ncbi:hypothetical protein [Chloroflexus sp.]|uniref:hypothetical protein n=1 Tax=Chloroflexus sp. TaxID=1904827 RepID=UPI002636B84D|nr:hypothetical protein [uncultured Chloroflexus sp.]